MEGVGGYSSEQAGAVQHLFPAMVDSKIRARAQHFDRNLRDIEPDEIASSALDPEQQAILAEHRRRLAQGLDWPYHPDVSDDEIL